MIDMLMLAAAAMVQGDGRPVDALDPPAGPTAGEQRTLSQPHPNMDLRMFPDLAVRDLRLSGDSLYVLVVNEGRTRSRGSIRVSAEAVADNVKVAAETRSGSLKARESRWVALKGFSAKAAAAGRPPLFALENAALVSAVVVEVPVALGVLDRSGQACDPALGCGSERNLANNGLRAEGPAIARGRP